MSSAADKTRDEDHILAAEYVLGLLAPAQVAAVESSLATNATLRAEVADWSDRFGRLTDDMPEVTPPARVWHAITGRIFPDDTVPFWRRLGLPQIAVGAALAAVVLWGAISFDLLRPAMPLRTDVVAEIGRVDTPVHFRAEYDSAASELRLVRLNGGPQPGRALEVWLIAGTAAPVSVMVWPDGAESVELRLPPELARVLSGATLAISDEPAGGSPTGAPTGAVLATGVAETL
ncbi:anti-sigma factor domain-containing protein [Pseudooceanicola nanhaiensis]|uniref:anti-sigma factor n=1 Tax=Pseudooceanicola nanhaiensis TaxID=375761 RepID=UPI001CD62208|nr:anti-sigma factor [Pseudooceanicola nanhaiensis]MCA0921106.1 anti-sigma factor [Pseudooceanicola nanhaiensis]